MGNWVEDDEEAVVHSLGFQAPGMEAWCRAEVRKR